MDDRHHTLAVKERHEVSGSVVINPASQLAEVCLAIFSSNSIDRTAQVTAQL